MGATIKSLNARSHYLSDSGHQLDVLEERPKNTSFQDRLKTVGHYPLNPLNLEILQINVGKMCNQTCKHCHVDAGPDRMEIMTMETMGQCLDVVRKQRIKTVDVTGGAPELNPYFRWLIEALSDLDVRIMVRCNLTIVLANPRFSYLPKFYREHKVEIISSLPHFSKLRTDSQRGDGVFDKSIKVLRTLNGQGYGMEGSDLILNLVYNPTGAFLPGSQQGLERDFKERLWNDHKVVFNELYTITNMPISRFLDYLIVSGNYEMYMDKLVNRFNPTTVEGLMCRNTLSVGWDGYLYDCDFNQMLDLTVAVPGRNHISDFDKVEFDRREIVVKHHCYGCTAGSGSSCGGAVV